MEETIGRKRKARPDGESNSITKFLPIEIITLNIVSRLPVDSVLDCMLVCKSWCKSIQNPYFRKIHQRQQLLDSGRHSNDK
ncbi:hypothetical protein MKX03_006601, partial [Papaver bracteatum]